ncbi:hypothetical protein BJX76DRAFT_358759 [Aspergillus varians]
MHGPHIEKVSDSCVRGFDALLKSLTACPAEFLEDIPTRTGIENDFARFKVWCGNLGALQRGRSSLDARLRNSAVMHETVLRFLHQLQDFIYRGIDVTTGGCKPWDLNLPPKVTGGKDDDLSDDDSASDDDSTELAECRLGIHDTIAYLYRLSLKIRNASYRSLSTKALSLRELDPETGEDLFSCYAAFDFQHVVESLQRLRGQPAPPGMASLLLASTGKDSGTAFLVDRLSRAITNRRRHFAYWRKNALKLSHSNLSISSEQPTEGVTGALHLQDPSDQLKVTDMQEQPMPGSELRTVISGTKISKYQCNLDAKLDSQSTISYATTAQDAEGKTVNFPPPPLDASSCAEFVCPYCYVACPSQQGKGKEPTYSKIFNLTSVHSVAALMETGSTRAKPGWSMSAYVIDDQLRLHLSEEHTDIIEPQITNILDLAETTAADNGEICPFCESAGPFDRGIYNHMAFHQEALARFAIPKYIANLEDLDNDDEFGSDKAKGIRSAQSLRSVSINFSEDVSNSTP